MEPATLTWEERFHLMTRDLEEYVGEEELKAMLKEGKHPKIYWGTATTGKPHFGYFVPMSKLADFLQAGCEVTILFADLHGFLDNMKSSWELLKHRTAYYEFIIREMLKVCGVPLDKLRFVRGTDYQLGQAYTLDMYKMAASVTTDHTIKAGAEVVKQEKNPLMSSLLYPILQALDEEHLGVDCQFGGVDQRKIFMFAREHLPRIGYKKRVHLMNPLVPGLGKSGKMSSSEPLSKVDFDDEDNVITDKFKQAYSVDGEVKGNGVLAMLKYVVFRRLETANRPFVVKRDAKWGGDMTFNSYKEVEEAFIAKTLASVDLKPAVAAEIMQLVKPLRDAIKAHSDLLTAAYPVEKKEPAAAPKSAPTTEATIASFDVVVGKIVHVERHPNADSLYVEKIDIGEGEGKERTVISGLVNFVPIEQMQNRLVLVIANLPSKTMRGVTSQGMVFAASHKSEDGKTSTAVALVDPPAGSKPGDRLVWPAELGAADPELSSKRMERVLKKLKTNADGVPVFVNSKGVEMPFTTSAGSCTSPLKDAVVS